MSVLFDDYRARELVEEQVCARDQVARTILHGIKT
jgi:hypothetical protein